MQLASTDANAAATLLQHTELTYLEKPDTPLLHMRPDVVRQTMKHGDDPLKDRTTTSTSFYSLINGDDGKQSLLQIRHTVQGHDLRQRTLHSAVSRYTGQVMRQQDTNGVYTHFYYDAVRRKVRETVAPGTSFEASCTYDYHLSVEAFQPTQVTTNVQKVVSTLLLDGLNRSVGEKREIDTANDPDNPVRKTFTVATKQYDSLGRQPGQLARPHRPLRRGQQRSATARHRPHEGTQAEFPGEVAERGIRPDRRCCRRGLHVCLPACRHRHCICRGRRCCYGCWLGSGSGRYTDG